MARKVIITKQIKKRYEKLKARGRLNILEVLDTSNPVTTLKGLVYCARKDGLSVKVLMDGKVITKF